MPEVLNELATIDVSQEAIEQLDLANIYRNFSEQYRKLDDLRKFRSDYEKENRLVRWWHNDKLRDAQLDSAEVQAEFSKTIGQLMLLSILQSKRLAEQQGQLNSQQGRLKEQADGIARHADELQKQHAALADQSLKLENLVHEYFALKGLTEEGAQKLIDIATEVKSTKEGMLSAFAERTQHVEEICGELSGQMDVLSGQMNQKIQEGAAQTEVKIAKLSQATEEAFENCESFQETVRKQVNELEAVRQKAEADLLGKLETVVADIAGLSKKQEDQVSDHVDSQRQLSARIQRLSYAMSGLSACVLAGLGAAAHILGWI